MYVRERVPMDGFNLARRQKARELISFVLETVEKRAKVRNSSKEALHLKVRMES